MRGDGADARLRGAVAAGYTARRVAELGDDPDDPVRCGADGLRHDQQAQQQGLGMSDRTRTVDPFAATVRDREP
jgi:hypothetical protein